MFMEGSVMLPPGNWKPELLIPVAGAIAAISRKKQFMRKFKHREGKDLWRSLRSKLVVVATMKGLVSQNGAHDHENEIEEAITRRSSSISLPKRGDCPVKTRFRKICKYFVVCCSFFTGAYRFCDTQTKTLFSFQLFLITQPRP